VDANTYYALTAGVWFSATSASGPWVVATYVPAVYTIPPSSRLYYVTYVKVYGATQEVVYVGYTPGYMGTVGPEGTVWVMQASSRIVDKNLNYDDLKTLDKKLKLPAGWKYRVKVLDQDLGIGAIDGIAHVTQDDLENTYNACFEANNQKNCSYKP
jgi:hypothetical protein